MWIVIGIAVGLVTVAIVLAVATRRGMSTGREMMTGEQMFVFGVIYTGAGVALVTSIGPAMIGVLALGIVFMGIGARRRHEEAASNRRD